MTSFRPQSANVPYVAVQGATQWLEILGKMPVHSQNMQSIRAGLAAIHESLLMRKAPRDSAKTVASAIGLSSPRQRAAFVHACFHGIRYMIQRTDPEKLPETASALAGFEKDLVAESLSMSALAEVPTLESSGRDLDARVRDAYAYLGCVPEDHNIMDLSLDELESFAGSEENRVWIRLLYAS